MNLSHMEIFQSISSVLNNEREKIRGSETLLCMHNVSKSSADALKHIARHA